MKKKLIFHTGLIDIVIDFASKGSYVGAKFGKEVMVQETWPGTFSLSAERISVYGEGFVIRQTENGRWYVTIPMGWAREAKGGLTPISWTEQMKMREHPFWPLQRIVHLW